MLSEKGLLAKVAPATLARVPAQYSGSAGDWVGVLARENVLAFNTGMIQEQALPASLLDLAKPEWKGKIAIAPTDADFLPLVGAVVALKGRPAALEWLKGLHDNAMIFDDDEGVVAAVDRGAAATGIINNYYWARLRMEKGADKMQSAIHHFAGGDVGALMNVSGAAVLKSSRNQAGAQKFLAFLVSKPGQEMISKLDITFEYPLVAGVAANPILKPMSELQPPSLTLKAARRRPRRRQTSARGRPDLMSQVVSLNVAERALGRGPRAPANIRGARARCPDRRRFVRRRARSAADPRHNRSGSQFERRGRR